MSRSSSVSSNPAQHLYVELTADHRGHRQGLFGCFAQASYPVGYDLPHAGGEAQVLEIGRQHPATIVALEEGSRLGQVADDLHHEEGVAARLPAKRMSEAHALVGHVVSGRRFEQVDDLDVFEAQEIEALDTGFPTQIGKGAGQGMGPR